MFKLIAGFIIILLFLALLQSANSKHQYQAIIDSGSTGSRLYIYRYDLDAPLQTIEELCSKRANPALAAFFGNRDGLNKYLQDLISFAEEKIHPDFHSTTSISLKATAGLRTIPVAERDWIMNEVQQILQNTTFFFNPLETRVLTGGEEALFGLLSINIAFSNLTSKLELSMGAGDLGGSSQQVAFVVPPKTFLQSFIDSYLQPFGMWSSSMMASYNKAKDRAVSTSSTDNSNKSIGGSASGNMKKDKVEENIADECLPNFAVTFPTSSPSSNMNSMMSSFFAPLAALASTYSPASMLANIGWLPSDVTRHILNTSKMSSAFFSHSALQSAFFSKASSSSVTINIYAKSMAGMGLVAAMNETFYYIAEIHQRRLYNQQQLALSSERLERLEKYTTEQLKSSIFQQQRQSDARICRSSLDLSDENTRYCHEKWDHHDETTQSTVDDTDIHREEIEFNESNDGDHLYGGHASWLHALQDTDEIIENPCAPPGENLPYPDALSTLRWQGTGDFDACVQFTRHLVEAHAMRDRKCLQQWQPQLPSAFIMMDNFPKVLQVMQVPIDLLNVTVTPAMIRYRGKDICQRPWTELQEIYPDYPAYRVQQVCFAASFMYVLMTDVYDLIEGEEFLAESLLHTPTWQKQVEESASAAYETHEDAATSTPSSSNHSVSDGLLWTMPTIGTSTMRFVAMDSHDSFTIGWPLGAAIISAMNITYTEDLSEDLADAMPLDATSRSHQSNSSGTPSTWESEISNQGTATSHQIFSMSLNHGDDSAKQDQAQEEQTSQLLPEEDDTAF